MGRSSKMWTTIISLLLDWIIDKKTIDTTTEGFQVNGGPDQLGQH
jgi:hypothetical protein